MSIATRIESIEEHIGNAYDELQGLGADLTNVNKNIENISMVLDDIYDSMPQVSGEGTSLTLDDTRVGKIKSTLKGNTSQTTYSGKNLFDKSNYVDNYYISSTGELVAENGNFASYYIPVSSGNYIISGADTKKIIRCAIYDSNQTFIRRELTTVATSLAITISNDEKYVRVSGYKVDLNTFQLEKGSTATSYEPYVGGTASPNPSYPQPVNVVSGDNEIRITGRNQASSNFEDYTQYDAAYAVMPIHLKPNTQYTLNCRLIGEQKSNYYNYGIVKDGDRYSNFVGLTTTIQYSSGQGGMATFTTTSEWTNPKLVCFLGNSNQETKFNELFTNYEIEFVEGQPTTYEPYQDNTYNIDLPVENLLNLPNVSTTSNGITATITNGKLKIVGTTTTNWFPICNLNIPLESGAYTFSYTNKKVIRYNLNIKYADNTTQVIYGNAYSSTPITLNQKATITALFSDNNTTGATFDYEDYLMIEKGSKANSYTPYGTTPIELCKIGNYQDYFYKDSDKWYLHKEIGKVVLNGSENWAKGASRPFYTLLISDVLRLQSASNNATLLCNYLSPSTPATIWGNNINGITNLDDSNAIRIRIQDDPYTITTFKEWLDDVKPVVYYVLATPTNELVEYQPLIDQLNLLEKALSKQGQTNISQVNNDLPFIISASALKEWQESTSLNSTLSMVNPLSLGNTLNTQDNTQPIEVDNIEPLEEEENEES